MSIFDTYKKEVQHDIEAVQSQIARAKTQKRVRFDAYVFNQIKEQITHVLFSHFSRLAQSETSIVLEPTAEHITTGDLTLKTFPAAAILQKSPVETASEFANALASELPESLTSVSVAGPYVNLSVKPDWLYNQVIKQVTNLQETYGESDCYASDVAFIEYSSPNIAKPIGVGHMRSTIIGQALANLHQAVGFSVIRDNHLGDWGTAFGALVYAYKTWGNEQGLEQEPLTYLKDLYVRFTKESQEQPELQEKAREMFTRLEQKDEDVTQLWKQFRDVSEKAFEKTYERLGVDFDLQIGEGYFEDQMDAVVAECLEKGFAHKEPDSEAVIVKDLDGLPTFLLRKQDGSSLYITRDLASLTFRVTTFTPDSLLYVVGAEQELHFRQLFALAKKLGYLPKRTHSKHIGFGLILSEGKKMATRRGTLIELDLLIEEAIKKSKQLLVAKKSELSEEKINETAEIIGIGALIYNDLRQSSIKNISFDWDRMLDFESGSAIYLQYTYARIQSILRNANTAPLTGDESAFTHETDAEFGLAKKLMLFPLVIEQAHTDYAPHTVAVYLEELAQQFNSFYSVTSILKTEDQTLQNSRLALVASVAQVIKNGLALLNIQVPEKM